ncbi:acyl carrier protein [Treponema parvum]|uniref:Acyl carrier protein n=1 Tax=Treponema parvum TaxID=138851 RepID=A0A975IE33_9SPIR|nr:acyl carrier protein [Treponema parvum]QTQ17422.1 acyl carrier protein [Treponema parvum]
MLEEVKTIIADNLKVDVSVLSEDTAIGDFPEWDSLHHLQIVAAIEQKYGFQFEPDVLMDLEDVSDIVNAVEKRTK